MVITPIIISKVIDKAVILLDKNELLIADEKNIVDMAINVGNLPLQGTKLLVNIAGVYYWICGYYVSIW